MRRRGGGAGGRKGARLAEVGGGGVHAAVGDCHLEAVPASTGPDAAHLPSADAGGGERVEGREPRGRAQDPERAREKLTASVAVGGEFVRENGGATSNGASHRMDPARRFSTAILVGSGKSSTNLVFATRLIRLLQENL